MELRFDIWQRKNIANENRFISVKKRYASQHAPSSPAATCSQGRAEVRWRPGQEKSLALLGSKCTAQLRFFDARGFCAPLPPLGTPLPAAIASKARGNYFPMQRSNFLQKKLI